MWARLTLNKGCRNRVENGSGVIVTLTSSANDLDAGGGSESAPGACAVRSAQLLERRTFFCILLEGYSKPETYA